MNPYKPGDRVVGILLHRGQAMDHYCGEKGTVLNVRENLITVDFDFGETSTFGYKWVRPFNDLERIADAVRSR